MERFNDCRSAAAAKKCWLLVQLTSAPAAVSPVLAVRVQNFILGLFHTLELCMGDADGIWFASTFRIARFPCFAIIDPANGGLVAKTVETDLVRWLRQFLTDHPEKGGPVEPEPGVVPSDDSDQDDAGVGVQIVAELQSRKRIRLSIGQGATASALYRKIAALIGKPRGSFELEIPLARLPDAPTPLPDIGEVVRVVDPWGLGDHTVP
jgi:hypothetical protein